MLSPLDAKLRDLMVATSWGVMWMFILLGLSGMGFSHFRSILATAFGVPLLGIHIVVHSIHEFICIRHAGTSLEDLPFSRHELGVPVTTLGSQSLCCRCLECNKIGLVGICLG